MLSTKRRTAFISGSAYEYGRFGDSGKYFIRDLSKALLQNDFKIISGFGSGVGRHVVDATLEEVYLDKKQPIEDRLLVFPFPSNGQAAAINNPYRTDLISRAGVAIFLFGNKLEDIAVKEADGMVEEFEIAREHGALLIPVGASGYTSEKLWKKLMDSYDEQFTDRDRYDLYCQLGDPTIDSAQLIDIILQIAR